MLTQNPTGEILLGPWVGALDLRYWRVSLRMGFILGLGMAAALAMSCREPPRSAREGESRHDAGFVNGGPQPARFGRTCWSAECEPFLVAELPTDRASGIDIDGEGFAYVTALFSDKVFKVPLSAGGKATLLYRSPGNNVWGVQVRGEDVLWSSNDDGRIYAAPRSGHGPIRVIAENLPGIAGFRIDGESLYWTDFSGSAPGTLWQRHIGGGPSVAIAANGGRGADVLVDGPGGDLLFTNSTAQVFRVPRDGGTPRIWLDAGWEAFGLAQDGEAFYVSTRGSVIRVSKRTGTPEVLVEQEGSMFSSVAVDATTVFWVKYADPASVWARRK